jgi:hypothetical protein
MNSIRYFLRLLFLGFLFSWVATSMPLQELNLLINSPFEEYMAKDLSYGYESLRTYYDFLPYTALFHFIVGLAIGAISKPGDIKI